MLQVNKIQKMIDQKIVYVTKASIQQIQALKNAGFLVIFK